jgi:hypothetical protein
MNSNDQTGKGRPEPETKKASSPSPGDNRGADDVDGNRSGGASKSTGPVEPESAESDDSSSPRNF